MTRKMGFTLAEVLITLGIIGVIAGLTIPALMNQTNKAEYVSALKKSLSNLNQSYSMLKNDNGGSIKSLCATNDSTCLANLFKPYLKYQSEVSGVPNSTNLPNCWDNAEMRDATESHVCLVLNDGTAIDFDEEYSDCNTICAIVNIDINGLKKPNKWGQDRYGFMMLDNNIVPLATNCHDGNDTWNDNAGCAYKYLYQ